MFSLRLPTERYPLRKNVFSDAIILQKNVLCSRCKLQKNVLYCFHPEKKVVKWVKRNAFSQLVTWKNDPERKPLIIRGARQVGKTWLMKEFGQSCYDSFVYFNFDEEDELKSIFEANKNPQRIIELLSMIAGEKILPGETLVIFDEVQECPEALNTLKYFKEKANDYHVHRCREPAWHPACPAKVLPGGDGQSSRPIPPLF